MTDPREDERQHIGGCAAMVWGSLLTMMACISILLLGTHCGRSF